MLVLTRRVGQKICIGTSIVVTLLKVDRNKARIGVEAPPDVPVLRQELFGFARRQSDAPADRPAVRAGERADHVGRPRASALHSLPTTRTLWNAASV